MLGPEFANFVRNQPFRPYRIRLSDARCTYDVLHPDMAVLGYSALIVGVRSKDKNKPGSHDEILISLAHVMQIEFLEDPEPSDVKK